MGTPFRFVDVQTRGPYRVWIHEHTFESRDGGTLVHDVVQYAVPGGRLSESCSWLPIWNAYSISAAFSCDPSLAVRNDFARLFPGSHRHFGVPAR